MDVIKILKGGDIMSKKVTRQPSVLVCVTAQESCARLISAGADIASDGNLSLIVLSVFSKRDGLNADSAVLENLYECAREYSAQMRVYFNDSPELVAAVVAKKENAVTMVTGFPKQGSSSFIAHFHEILPDMPITMVDEEGKAYHILPPSLPDMATADKSVR